MTSLGETNRHNLATEKIERDKVEISWNTLAENIRHNMAEEGLKYDTLRETVRNNSVMNKYYMGSLAETENHNRNVELRDLEELAEAIRHNLAVEKESWRNHTATEAEISAHNQAEEWLKQLDIAVNAWKANGGKSSSSTGGGGKAGDIVSDILSGPYLSLLKGLAPGVLNSITGGAAYAISSQQNFRVRDKFNQYDMNGAEPDYQRVNLDYLDRSNGRRGKDEIPTDNSQSYGPGYSNVPVSDISNRSTEKVVVGQAPSVSNVPVTSYSGGRGGVTSGGNKKSSIIYHPSTSKNNSNSGPGVIEKQPISKDPYSPASTARTAGFGGEMSPTGGGSPSGGGYGGGSR